MFCPNDEDRDHLLGDLPIECDCCASFADGVTVGRRSERSKIAAWLRTRRGDLGLTEEIIVRAIERGEYK
jgi:hypothetical protein